MADKSKKIRTGYECPECDWNPPEDEYFILFKHVFQLNNFWNWKHPDKDGSYPPNRILVKKDGEGFRVRFLNVRAYPIRTDGSTVHDHHCGITYQKWHETHRCPKHGEFVFENANA